MTSKERCCGRSMGIIYSILYSDIRRGRDARGSKEILEGLYGPMSRSVRKMRKLNPGRGSVDLLDVPMLIFIQWMKDRDRVPGIGFDSSRDRFGLMATFEEIQTDIGWHKERGHAYNYGQSEGVVLLPVSVDGECQRFWREGNDVQYPVRYGYPMSIADHSQLYPYRFTEDARSGISSNTIQPGTIWVREENILNKMLNLIWLTGMIDFDKDRESIELGCPDLSSEPTIRKRQDSESRVVIIFGIVASLESDLYNVRGGDSFGRLDANKLNSTYIFEHSGMHFRHYRVLKDESMDSDDGTFSGSVGERVLTDLLEDAKATDEPGVKRTAVVIGQLDLEIAIRIIKSCVSKGIPYGTTYILDRGGGMDLFFQKCRELFEDEKTLSGFDGPSLRRSDHRRTPQSHCRACPIWDALWIPRCPSGCMTVPP